MHREISVRAVACALLFLGALPAHAGPRGIKRVRHGAAAEAQRLTAALGPTNPVCVDASKHPVTCHVLYFGGAVLSNAKVYAVLWGNAVAQETKDKVAGFFTALTNSDWVDGFAEYNTGITVQAGSRLGQQGSNQVVGRGTFAGAFTITPQNKATSINDAAIIAELGAQLDAKALPPNDANTLYAIFFPPGMTIDDGTGSFSCTDWCGYHSTWTRAAKSAFYAVLPDHNDPGCNSRGCGSSSSNFANLCATAAHEVAESITDAETGLVGNTDDYPLAWYDHNGGEVGDMCSAQDQITSIVDGSSWEVQQIYSEVTKKCQTTRTDAQDFKVFLNPNSRSLAAGTSQTFAVNTATTAGSPQALALTVTGLPAGVTAQLDNASPTSGSTAQLTLTASASAAAAADAVVAIVASGQASGARKHSAALLLQVTTGAPLGNDFTLTVAPGTGIATAGGNTADFVVTTGALRNPESITLAASGLPAGVTAAFNPGTVLAGGTSSLTLTAPAGTARAAAAGFTITGTSASVPAGHTATAQLAVHSAPTASLTTPVAGASLSGTADVTAGATVDAAATLSNLELLDGATVIGSAITSPLTVHWNTVAAADGSHTLTARATDSLGNAVTSAPVQVTVANGAAGSFLLRLDQLAVTLAAGGQATVNVVTTAVGAPPSVAFAVSGLPTGVTGAFSPASVTAGGSSTLTLTAAASTASGNSSFTVTGTAGATSRTASGSLTVAPAASGPQIQLTAPADGVLVNGNVQLKATATPGAGATLTRIDFLADGAVVGTATASPATVLWDASAAAAGAHAITAKATDSAGRSATSAAVSVTVAARGSGSGGGCAGGGSGLLALAGLLALRRRRS